MSGVYQLNANIWERCLITNAGVCERDLSCTLRIAVAVTMSPQKIEEYFCCCRFDLLIIGSKVGLI